MTVPFKKLQCFFCAVIYDEAVGWPEEGIAPGTRWTDIDEGWICPGCGSGKSDFMMVEI